MSQQMLRVPWHNQLTHANDNVSCDLEPVGTCQGHRNELGMASYLLQEPTNQPVSIWHLVR